MRSIAPPAFPAALALLLFGCAPTDEIGSTTQSVVDPVPTSPGAHELAFEVSNGDQREVLLYLPTGYLQLRRKPYPLVAMFHGLGGSAAGFAATLDAAGMRALADQQGKIVVFFQGTLGLTITSPGYWDMNGVTRDDLLYVEEVLDHLDDELNVDTARVFAGGHSLGGRFVHELGSRIPARFRAIADVSGFYGTATGEPAPPPAGTLLPVLIVHGALDPIVPPGGGVGALLPGVDFQPTQYTYDSWYANDSCTEPTFRALSMLWDIQSTHCRATESDAIIEFVSVAGLDHRWPTAAQGLDAADTMFGFFDMQ